MNGEGRRISKSSSRIIVLKICEIVEQVDAAIRKVVNGLPEKFISFCFVALNAPFCPIKQKAFFKHAPDSQLIKNYPNLTNKARINRII